MTDRLAYSVREAAEALGLSKTSILRAIRRGELPSERIGNKIIIPARALEALVEKAVAS